MHRKYFGVIIIIRPKNSCANFDLISFKLQKEQQIICRVLDIRLAEWKHKVTSFLPNRVAGKNTHFPFRNDPTIPLLQAQANQSNLDFTALSKCSKYLFQTSAKPTKEPYR